MLYVKVRKGQSIEKAISIFKKKVKDSKILYELREHSAGLNCGRWDYIFSFIKKFFGTLIQKPWEKEQMAIDSLDEGRAFDISSQKSAVIIIFGIATVLFSLVFTAYLYTIPPEQDTMYLLKPNLLWINTIILLFVTPLLLSNTMWL